MSKSVEQFVAGITESGRDVAFVGKLVIDSGDINLYIGEFILHILYSQF